MLPRVLSAVAGLSLLLAVTYWGGNLGIVLLATLIVAICTWEFTQLFSKSLFSTLLFLIACMSVFATHVMTPQLTLPVLVGAFLVLSSKGLLLFAHEDTPQTYLNIEWTLWGLIYCALLPALTLQLTLVVGWQLIYFLLITVFFGDIFALFSGMIFGGRKILPKISPKKTVSGAIGGLVGSCLSGVIFVLTTSSIPIDYLQWTGICLTIGFFAQAGDFFESMIKRYSGKKDSGKLMPGHGGLLDRVDGVYFGSIVLYLYSFLIDLHFFFS